jgi:ketosteroid isomerase-like protein
MTGTLGVAIEYFDSFNRRDWSALRDVLHREYTYTGRDGEQRVGVDAGVEHSQRFADRFPGLILEVKSIHDFSDGAVVEFVPTLGERDERNLGAREPWICAVLEIKDGRIHTEREYWQQSVTG